MSATRDALRDLLDVIRAIPSTRALLDQAADAASVAGLDCATCGATGTVRVSAICGDCSPECEAYGRDPECAPGSMTGDDCQDCGGLGWRAS